MHELRATLIQDISNFLGTLKTALDVLLPQYSYTGINEEDVLVWLIAEELELSYLLFTVGHNHYGDPYRQIHSDITDVLGYNLSMLVSFYILAPQVYADFNEIQVRLVNNDLFIDYYRDPRLPKTMSL